MQNIRRLAPRVEALLPNFVVFDFEWDTKGRIFAASFVSRENEKVILGRDYPSEASYIDAIQQEIMHYQTSIGWNSLGLLNARDSDLDQLTLNAERVGVTPIFDRQTRKVKQRDHIDLLRVFDKKLVRNSMFKNRYRDVKLETVSQCFLKRGKTGHGKDAETYELARLSEYVLEDSRLVFDLLSVGMFDKDTEEPTFDGALLDTMAAIGTLVDISFAQACNGNLSQWWSKIMQTARAPDAQQEYMVREGDERYKGGELIEPIPGLYHNVDVLDVQSLYPTMIENYNLSHETVNCDCCASDVSAKLPDGVINRPFWVCKKREGILAGFIRKFKAERVKQKKAGNTAQAEGLKILINGAYGLYGSSYFKYSDRRVAELTTALARWTTFKQIKPIAEMAGFKVIYGDTDSIFCLKEDEQATISNIIETVGDQIAVVLEHDKIYVKLVISKKKHYMGKQLQKDGSFKVVVKGIEWIKGDRGKWVNQTGKKIEEAFKNDADCYAVVKKALDDLDHDRVNTDTLLLGMRLSKDPKEYSVTSMQAKVARLNPDAVGGNVVFYYKGIGDEPTRNPRRIDKNKYRELLLNTCEDVLKIMGYKTEDLSPHTQTLEMLWST